MPPAQPLAKDLYQELKTKLQQAVESAIGRPVVQRTGHPINYCVNDPEPPNSFEWVFSGTYDGFPGSLSNFQKEDMVECLEALRNGHAKVVSLEDATHILSASGRESSTSLSQSENPRSMLTGRSTAASNDNRSGLERIAGSTIGNAISRLKSPQQGERGPLTRPPQQSSLSGHAQWFTHYVESMIQRERDSHREIISKSKEREDKLRGNVNRLQTEILQQSERLAAKEAAALALQSALEVEKSQNAERIRDLFDQKLELKRALEASKLDLAALRSNISRHSTTPTAVGPSQRPNAQVQDIALNVGETMHPTLQAQSFSEPSRHIHSFTKLRTIQNVIQELPAPCNASVPKNLKYFDINILGKLHSTDATKNKWDTTLNSIISHEAESRVIDWPSVITKSGYTLDCDSPKFGHHVASVFVNGGEGLGRVGKIYPYLNIDSERRTFQYIGHYKVEDDFDVDLITWGTWNSHSRERIIKRMMDSDWGLKLLEKVAPQVVNQYGTPRDVPTWKVQELFESTDEPKLRMKYTVLRFMSFNQRDYEALGQRASGMQRDPKEKGRSFEDKSQAQKQYDAKHILYRQSEADITGMKRKATVGGLFPQQKRRKESSVSSSST